MSNFWALTIRPDSTEPEPAEWLDDYYGAHRYGVRFEDQTVIPEDQVKFVEYYEPPDRGKV